MATWKTVWEDKELEKIKLKRITPVKGKDYFDGEDGYTPVKGVDYYTPEEIEEIKKEVTPIKGVHYFDGKDGYTPIKNVDYFDGKDGKSIKGRDGKDGKSIKGKDGKDGSPDTPKDIKKKLEALKGDDRLDASAIKNLPKGEKKDDRSVFYAGSSVTGGDATDKVSKAGDTMTGDLVGTDFVPTRSGTVTRVGNFISSIQLVGGRQLEYTRNDDNYVVAISDGTRVTTITRDASNNILSWSIA